MDYEDLGLVARGKFSELHKARNKVNNKVCAIKKVQIFEMDTEGRKQCENEASILQSLPDHPNIIKYLHSFFHENQLFLVLELAEGGDLQRLLDQARKEQRYFDEVTIWTLFYQVCCGVQLMHSRRIMHRDIKPANVFLSADRRIVKLGDLGVGRYLSSKTYQTFSLVGTPFYMSPEAITNTGYDFKSDIWSLGCLLYELATLKSPFYAAELNYYSLGQRIMKCQYDGINACYSQHMHRLIAATIQATPEDRPGIDQVVQMAAQGLEFARKQATMNSK
jgi:NIMA (never in mitosis gene a)-related kinase